jgi:hypothetical protein
MYQGCRNRVHPKNAWLRRLGRSVGSKHREEEVLIFSLPPSYSTNPSSEHVDEPIHTPARRADHFS